MPTKNGGARKAGYAASVGGLAYSQRSRPYQAHFLLGFISFLMLTWVIYGQDMTAKVIPLGLLGMLLVSRVYHAMTGRIRHDLRQLPDESCHVEMEKVAVMLDGQDETDKKM